MTNDNSTTDAASRELPTRYDPHATEARWYPHWEQHGYFKADVNAPGEPYCIVIPPPNITGILHMGHALNNTLQDVLIRWKRMAGYNALWIPGTDHASIATQYVVEKKLREEGMERPRETLGREKFLDEIWKWKEKHGGIIVDQLKRLGSSCDWSRERFTMDEGLSRAVRHVFARLYEQGHIYRGNYLVNWCPRCQTTLADDEVEYKDSVGKLWHLKYPIEGEPGRFATVATTRPETMLGDTAVAVNPKDERYSDLIGKYCLLPLVNRRIPIIADDFVEREFGTGMVKITPAHDPNDYQAGKRHNLEEINVLTPDAHINENGGAYEGLDRYEARRRIVADMEAQGLLEKIEDHPQRIGACYRCASVVEPYLSLQWFVKIAPLAEKARKSVEEGRVNFHPDARKADYFRWIDNVRDWAISRQLWWGHQIPAFYEADGTVIVPASDEEYAALRARVAAGDGLRQDDDVLDTWFSSALWPFSTLGWPDKTAELDKYYPTATLVTAKDIIFFWVARMIMMGEHFMDTAPFSDVYFNPIVGDEHGKKMSKSKGNALDPLDLIGEFGTDALRITLAAYAGREQHIAFSTKELEGYRNFMNKIWNATRLILSNLEDMPSHAVSHAGPLHAIAREELALEDRWILSRFAETVEGYNKALEEFQFDQAVKVFREFFWNDFCDYYLELVKPRLYANQNDLSATPESIHSRTNAQALLFTLLESSMRLLHPICPFITEEIWQVLRNLRSDDIGFNSPGITMTSHIAPPIFSPSQDEVIEGVVNPNSGSCDTLGTRSLAALESKSIMISSWVDFDPEQMKDSTAVAQTEVMQQVLYAIRNIRGEMRIPPGVAASILLVTPDSGTRDLLVEHGNFFTTLTNIKSLLIKEAAEPPAFAATAVTAGVTIFVELPEELRGQERERLQKEVSRLEKECERLVAKLANSSFTSKAPADVIQKEQEKLTSQMNEMDQLRAKLAMLL